MGSSSSSSSSSLCRRELVFQFVWSLLPLFLGRFLQGDCCFQVCFLELLTCLALVDSEVKLGGIRKSKVGNSFV